MNLLDIFILVIAGAALIKGCFRGLVRELASLAAVILGFLGANQLAPDLFPMLQTFISTPLYAQIAGYLLVFLAVVGGVILVSTMLRKLLAAGGLGGFDRFLGGVFGLFKGVLICTLLFMLLTTLISPETQLLRASRLAPSLQRASSALALFLPDTLQDDLKSKGQKLQQNWDNHWLEETRKKYQEEKTP